MDLLPKSKLWREIIIFGIFILLVVVFYVEEDWRGKHAWENCQRELAAKGETVDWKDFIPPPVPADKNFFAAPKMQDWFAHNWSSTDTDLSKQFSNTNNFSDVTNKITAQNYLEWSDQFQSDFVLVREALKQPYAQMYGDYSYPLGMPYANFANLRIFLQIFAQRAKCHLLLHQSEKALEELALLNNLRRTLECAPAAKSPSGIDNTFNASTAGIYVDVVNKGLQSHEWADSQLVIIQKQLRPINFLSLAVQTSELDAAQDCWVFKGFLKKYPSDPSLWWCLKHFTVPWTRWIPSGWIYQNMVTTTKVHEKIIEAIDLTNNMVRPKKIGQAQLEYQHLNKNFGFYSFLMQSIGLPEISREFQLFSYSQTFINEAQIACALERYHLAYGNYPETLDALAPQFIEKIPHDIIGGAPLHYRLAENGKKFVLYSVGWNETDDGGLDLSADGKVNYTNGDWVWKN